MKQWLGPLQTVGEGCSPKATPELPQLRPGRKPNRPPEPSGEVFSPCGRPRVSLFGHTPPWRGGDEGGGGFPPPPGSQGKISPGSGPGMGSGDVAGPQKITQSPQSK